MSQTLRPVIELRPLIVSNGCLSELNPENCLISLGFRSLVNPLSLHSCLSSLLVSITVCDFRCFVGSFGFDR
ncbi:hypothetical protein Hanom_Chr07g00653751 [Helianthus anomalus]